MVARHDRLLGRAKERVERLDTGIQQAQQRETNMIEMSQWMSEVTTLLHSRSDRLVSVIWTTSHSGIYY